MFGWFAARGYACVRVDIRGCGDSDGILLGEYLAQEQDDALDVLAWIAAQPWSDGGAGMIGLSWTGFNGLQVAYRRPPQLKAVISCCSTDDRYGNDIHYMGGCVLGVDMLSWATTMLGYTPGRHCPTWSAGPGGRAGWQAHRRDAAVRRGAGFAPATRQLLEARLGGRVLQHDRLPAADGRRLGRCLPEHRPARVLEGPTDRARA